MAKILKIGQDFVEGHIVETLHKLDDKLDDAATTDRANQIASDLAGTAIIAANANNAAANAVVRLAGDNHYFEGTGIFTGTPNNYLVPVITPVTESGINYTAGFFTFSYRGKYLVAITQGGDCINTRSDWYQEVSIGMKDVVGGGVVPLTFKSIPPSGTWNMENTSANLIDVVSGAQWKPVINMVTNGSTTNGQFRIKIKKVI